MKIKLVVIALLFFVTTAASPAFASVKSSPTLYNFPDAPNSAVSSSQNLSLNWSGYVADTGQYTSVTGTWIVPTVSSSNTTSADATWVGIGGAHTTDLIQAGTQAIVQNGAVQYQAWYETLPNASTDVALTVHPGDSVTSTITETATNTWLVTIKDNTTGDTYSNTLNYTSSLSSAEWIEEMPSDTASMYLPLDNFGTIPFTNATATLNTDGIIADGTNENLTSLGAHSVLMTSQGGQFELATASAIGSDGQSFTITRTNSSLQTQPRAVSGNRGGFLRGQGFQIIRYLLTTGQGNGSSTPQVQTFNYGPYTIQVSFGGGF